LRDAAALAYVFERSGELHLPLTLRHGGLRHHRGQVSLPGGRPDPGETLFQTALREAEEEIALKIEGLEALGTLHPVNIPVSHSRLHVHVAHGPAPDQLVPNPGEVERIEIVSLAQLLDPGRRKWRRIQISGREIDVPYFDVAGLFLWGATAMALSELAERIRALRPPS
jgi:8-oxo-dGTP pyrophosphatase MutT (NUDIX family)